MKREREGEDTANSPVKKQRLLPSNHELHIRLKKLGLPVTGTKKTMMSRLRYNQMKKTELVDKIKEMWPDVHVPLKVYKRDLVILMPKFDRAKEMTVPELRSKLLRNHHFVHEMPAESASKDEHISAFIEAMIYKTVGLHAESDEESEIDMLYRKQDLLHQLNNIDTKNIRFSPSLLKSELVKCYHKYIIEIEAMTKEEIRELMKEKFPDHLPLSSVKKREHCIALARCLFHEEFGGKVLDDPKGLHVTDLESHLKEEGINVPDGLQRSELEELYNVLIYGAPYGLRKRSMRQFLTEHGVEHGLSQADPKSVHIKAYQDFFKKKHNIE